MLGEFRKKRNRDPLASNAHENRYSRESQTQKVYLEGNRARPFLSPSQERANILKAQSAGWATWGIDSASLDTYFTPSKKIFSPCATPIVKTPELFRIQS